MTQSKPGVLDSLKAVFLRKSEIQEVFFHPPKCGRSVKLVFSQISHHTFTATLKKKYTWRNYTSYVFLETLPMVVKQVLFPVNDYSVHVGHIRWIISLTYSNPFNCPSEKIIRNIMKKLKRLFEYLQMDCKLSKTHISEIFAIDSEDLQVSRCALSTWSIILAPFSAIVFRFAGIPIENPFNIKTEPSDWNCR